MTSKTRNMCYDIAYSITLESLEDYFGNIVIDDPQIEMDLDLSLHILAQSFSKNVVVINEDNVLKAKRFEWGIIADYMDTPEKIKKMRSMMCNAQSEKVLCDRRSYWHRIRHQRCLIPVKGIYEHREVKGWKNKVPYFVTLKNRDIFCIPGLYHYAPVPNVETGEVRGTYTLLTRSANSLMQQIHNGGPNAFRMPLFLPKELEMKWLDPNLNDGQISEILGFEMPSDALEYRTVYTIRSTKQRPDNGLKIDPFEWQNLPPLRDDNGQIQKELF